MSVKSVTAHMNMRSLSNGFKLLRQNPREFIKLLYSFLHTTPNPIVVYSEVTANCNNRCYFCAQDKVDRKGFIKDEVKDRVANIISSYPDNRFKVYFHLLGEPLRYKGLLDYIRLLSMPNAELWMSTNGVYLDDEMLYKLKKAGLKNIWYTMFYTNEADYNKNTRSDNYSKARDNLQNLISKSNMFERIHIVTFSEKADNIEKMIEHKINVTLRKCRTAIPWKYKPGLKDRQICVSINGDLTYHYYDYDFKNSAGNVCNLDNEAIMRGYHNKA